MVNTHEPSSSVMDELPGSNQASGPSGSTTAVNTDRLDGDHDPEIGTQSRDAAQLQDFELIKVLGKGQAGRVLLTRQSLTGRVFAMKAISKHSVFSNDEFPHILTERNILRQIAMYEAGNDFIARLRYSFADKENFYFVMDFYPGGDLATQMEIYGVLGPDRSRFYASDIAQGLEDLHRHGIIVRDLKPENILLNTRGHAVLADFGLSKHFPYRGTPVRLPPWGGDMPEWANQGTGSLRQYPDGRKVWEIDQARSFVGTSEYIAPEVVLGRHYSYAVDWWAFGCILVECIVGRTPFRQDDVPNPVDFWDQVVNEPWDGLFDIDPRVATKTPDTWGFDEVTMHFIDALLQKEPSMRLTEPYVKEHAYFFSVDWDHVLSGAYLDPGGLQFHETIEDNTQYFPRLCLDETPSVDMKTHGRYSHRDSLTEEVVMHLAEIKFRKELSSFAWSWEWEQGQEMHVEHALPHQLIDMEDEWVGISSCERPETPSSAYLRSLPPLPASPDAEGLDDEASDSVRIEEPDEEIIVPKIDPQPPSAPHLGLPLTLPSSGLSVSDVVTLPSPTSAAPVHLLRRHHPRRSEDSIPISRLSVELSGAVRRLDNDDWEELEAEGEASNDPADASVAPRFFTFARRLRGRKSSPKDYQEVRKVTSPKASASVTSDLSRDASPTKKGKLSMRDGARRALEALRVLPKTRRRSEQFGIGFPLPPPSANPHIQRSRSEDPNSASTPSSTTGPSSPTPRGAAPPSSYNFDPNGITPRRTQSSHRTERRRSWFDLKRRSTSRVAAAKGGEKMARSVSDAAVPRLELSGLGGDLGLTPPNDSQLQGEGMSGRDAQDKTIASHTPTATTPSTARHDLIAAQSVS